MKQQEPNAEVLVTKKSWAKPNLIVIDSKNIEGGLHHGAKEGTGGFLKTGFPSQTTNGFS